jgi:xanthine dehydrogenase YagR molybdenum-binding subunit
MKMAATAQPLLSRVRGGSPDFSIDQCGGAVANAIYNATGVRVRDYPVTLVKLLAGLRTV